MDDWANDNDIDSNVIPSSSPPLPSSLSSSQILSRRKTSISKQQTGSSSSSPPPPPLACHDDSSSSSPPNEKYKTKQNNNANWKTRIHRHWYRPKSKQRMLVLCFLLSLFLFWILFYNSLFGGKQQQQQQRFEMISSSSSRRRRRRTRLEDELIPLLLPFPSSSSFTASSTIFSTSTPSPQMDWNTLDTPPPTTDTPSDSRDEIPIQMQQYENEDDYDVAIIIDPLKNYSNPNEIDDFYDFYLFDDDDHPRHEGCRHVSLFYWNHPICNHFHELTFEEDVDVFVNHGYERDVWFVSPSSSSSSPPNNETIVLKTLRYHLPHSPYHYQNIKSGAMVMERLTSSPRITTIYGQCGTSELTEAFLVNDDFESKVVFGSGFLDTMNITLEDDSQDVDPQNELEPTDKLEYALQMAESLADLHGYEDGVIVLNDVQVQQWMESGEEEKDGDGRRLRRLKLNDFSRVKLLLFDEKNGIYCKHRNRYRTWYRSPEENLFLPLDEKTDVFSLGNNFYGLLTGLWNYYQYEEYDYETLQEKVIEGELPYIDERYRTRSYAEGELVKVMEKCYTYDPAKRPSIFKVVKWLQSAVDTNRRHLERT